MQPKQYLGLDIQFFYEVATGLESGLAVAQRYGLTPDQWEEISHREDFTAAIQKIRQDINDAGPQAFKIKASIMADKLLDNMFKAAIGRDVPVREKAAALQLLTKVAELEPTKDVQAAQGSGFSITINVPKAVKQANDVITVKPREAEPKRLESAGIDLSFMEEKNGEGSHQASD